MSLSLQKNINNARNCRKDLCFSITVTYLIEFITNTSATEYLVLLILIWKSDFLDFLDILVLIPYFCSCGFFCVVEKYNRFFPGEEIHENNCEEIPCFVK